MRKRGEESGKRDEEKEGGEKEILPVIIGEMVVE